MVGDIQRQGACARWRRSASHGMAAGATVVLALLGAGLPLPAGGGPGHAGAPDPSFNSGGSLVSEFLGSASAAANGVAIQNDGKIVLAITNSGVFSVMRLNPDGSPDPSFQGGMAHFNSFPDLQAQAVAVQKDGKIVAVGGGRVATDRVFVVARFNPNGTLDSSPVSDGFTIAFFGTEHPRDDDASAVAIQTDGKIIAAGTSLNANGGRQFALARFNPDLRLDATFGAGTGRATTDFGGTALCQALALQKDGRIVAAGRLIEGAADDFALARYNRDGSPDGSFGIDGKVTTDFGRAESAGGVAVQADGKIVAAGVSFGPGGTKFALARYRRNGSPDPSFGDKGKVLSDLGDQTSDPTLPAMAVQKDGKFVLAGSRAVGNLFDFLVARYQKNGHLDSSFSTDGWVTTDFGGFDYAAAVAVQKDGRILAAGSTFGPSSSKIALARYLGR